jgi:hypothetical protein
VFGGDEAIRTLDLLGASEALCQLSYVPKPGMCGGPQWIRTIDLILIRDAL